MPFSNHSGVFSGRTFGYLSLGLMTVTAGLVAACWSYRAAGQNPVRPYVPRPSEVRPLARTQPPPSPGSAAGAKAGAPPVAGPDDQRPKQPVIELEDPLVDEKSGITTGNDFTYREDDYVVNGAHAKYNKNTRELFCNGSLVFDNPKHHVTGDRAYVDNKKTAKLAKFDGSVIIVLKPKPGDGAADDINKEKNKGATIYCDHVEDFFKKDFVILTGHFIVKQQITKANGKTVQRTLTAHHAEYDGKKEQLHLFAPVDGTDTDNQEVHFKNDVFVGTKEGQETLASKGRFKGVFNSTDDPDEVGPTAGDQTDKTAPPDAGAAKTAEPPAGSPKPADPIPTDTKPPADKK